MEQCNSHINSRIGYDKWSLVIYDRNDDQYIIKGKGTGAKTCEVTKELKPHPNGWVKIQRGLSDFNKKWLNIIWRGTL